MILKNTANQWVCFYVHNTSTNAPYTGLSTGTFTMKLFLTANGAGSFGTAAALTNNTIYEVDSTNAPGIYTVKLAAADTNADIVVLSGINSTANTSIRTEVYFTSSAELQVDMVKINGSAGAATNLSNFMTPAIGYQAYSSSIGLGTLIVTGQATAGASTTITLDSNASTTLSAYVGYTVSIIQQANNPAAVGQTRKITGYTTGRVATVDSAWTVNPDTSTVYAVRDDRVRLTPSGLDDVLITPSATGIVGSPNFNQAVTLLYQRFFGKVVKNSSNIIVYKSDGSTAAATSGWTTVGSTDTINAAS